MHTALNALVYRMHITYLHICSHNVTRYINSDSSPLNRKIGVSTLEGRYCKYTGVGVLTVVVVN